MAMAIGDPLRRAAATAVGGPTEEEGPVGEIGEGVVLGQVGVDPELLAEPPADRERNGEEGQVEAGQAEDEVAIEAVEPGGHVGADRGVGEVDLQHADPPGGRPGS